MNSISFKLLIVDYLVTAIKKLTNIPSIIELIKNIKISGIFGFIWWLDSRGSVVLPFLTNLFSEWFEGNDCQREWPY